MRAIIYLRQSLDRAGDELGVKRQEAECRRLCDVRGYHVADVIVDNSVSATHGHRPGYQRLLQAIESDRLDVVVVLRIDRLLRRLTDLEALIELSERTGVQVATVNGDVDLTSSSGRLIGRILASVARSEMEIKSERQALANRQKAMAGKPHGSRRPYAYEADLVTIRESEAVVLREMARRIIAGHSYKDVAWWLNEQGHTTTLGRQWLPLTVRNILLKKRYAGIREYDGAEYPAIWQPVFDQATWEQLQLTMRLRKTAAEGRGTVRARKYLLTGLVYCGACGMPLNGATKRDHPGRPLRRTYHCRVQGDTKRGRGCGGVVRNADALDDWIKECVIYRLDSPALSELLSARTDDAELRGLLEARKAQSLRIEALVDDYATGLLTREQFAKAKTTAEAELGRIDREVERASKQRIGAGLVPAGQTVREAWDNSESDAWRRGLLSLVIKRIDVRPGVSKPRYKQWRFDPSLIDVHWIA